MFAATTWLNFHKSLRRDGKCPQIVTGRALRSLLFPSIYAALDFPSAPQGFMTIEKRRSRFSRNYLWIFEKNSARIYGNLAVGGGHFLYDV